MRPTSVLFLSPLLSVGGEELSTLSLARELIRRGHRVGILGSKGPLWEELERAGVRMADSGPYRRSLAGIHSQARIIRRLIAEWGIEIVHSQSVLPTLAAAWALREASKREIPLIFHDRAIHRYSYVLLGRLFNRLTTCVIANSDYEKRRLIQHGVKESHCIRVYNCVNVAVPDNASPTAKVKQELGIAAEAMVVGTVGRLVKEKGLTFLLRAFARVVEACPRTVLLLVGSGEMHEELTREVARLGISGQTIFRGARRDLGRIYPVIDVFVLSSIFETFGNAALEAALFGKAVVATHVGGLPEAVVHGETGILVPPGDVGALSVALLRLLRNRDESEAMGRAGRERVRRYFTPERVADEVEQVYEHLLSRPAE